MIIVNLYTYPRFVCNFSHQQAEPELSGASPPWKESNQLLIHSFSLLRRPACQAATNLYINYTALASLKNNPKATVKTLEIIFCEVT